MVGAFAQAFKTLQSLELARWFHFSEVGLTVGIFRLHGCGAHIASTTADSGNPTERRAAPASLLQIAISLSMPQAGG
jgi:hypothetical protein